MKQLSVLVVILIIVAVGAFWFYREWGAEGGIPTPEREVSSEVVTAGTDTTARGLILRIDAEAVAYDGPLYVLLEVENGSTATIAIPSMGFNLCAARQSISDPYALKTGEIVEVQGELDASGNIVPCQGAEHYLRIVTE